MSVIVTLPVGGTVEYGRSDDGYVMHRDGSLDVVRMGVRQPHRYAAGSWSAVEGDQHRGWLGFWR